MLPDVIHDPRVRAAAAPPDGQFRKLVPSDQPAFLAHLLRLDPLSRFTRFAGTASDAVVRRHVARVFAGDVVLVGYFVDGELRGAAELHAIDRRAGAPAPGARPPRAAETAFSVERPWQGKGVGSALMRQLVLLAQNRGIERLHVSFLASNGRMKRIAVHRAADLHVEGDEIFGCVRAPRATPFSRLREWTGDVFALLGAVVELQARLLSAPLRGI